MTTNDSRSSQHAPADDSDFQALAAQVRREPDDDQSWEALESYASRTQQSSLVADLYREVLASSLPTEVARVLGQRAVAFHEEWFGEDSPALSEVLDSVLSRDPTNEWAFQRLTVIHTVAERWSQLMLLYDRALAAEGNAERRGLLLEEAAQVAKDFAADPDRAIGYLQSLYLLRSDDAQLASSLERLLERQERWRDLIEYWRSQLPRLASREGYQLRGRIAECYLEKLDDAGAALAEAEALLPGALDAGPIGILERILRAPSGAVAARRAALNLLKDYYESENRTDDLVRTLSAGLEFVDPQQGAVLLRESAERLIAASRGSEAMETLASLLRLEPDAADALDGLRSLADELQAHDRLVTALLTAADAATDAAARVRLYVLAAEIHESALGTPGPAIELYQRVLADAGAAEEVSLRVARRLGGLLARENRDAERLTLLEDLASREPDAQDRRSTLGAAALLAAKLGDEDRALGLWARRIADNPKDVEALDARVALLDARGEPADLVVALRQRAEVAVSPAARRADLERAARLLADELADQDGAIAIWEALQNECGEDGIVVDALAALYAAAGRTGDAVPLLRRAAEREASHVAEVLTRLGDNHRGALAQPRAAVGFYADALRVAPGHEGARAGILALIEQASGGPEAIEALALAYRAKDDHRGLLDLCDARLKSTDDATAKARILREAAHLEEHHGGGSEAAFARIAEAFALTPDDLEIEAELRRLGELTAGDAATLEAYQRAIAVTSSPTRRIALLERVADQAAGLGESEIAVSACQEILQQQPGRRDILESFVASAGKTGSWNLVADAALSAIATRGSIEGWMIESLETTAEDPASLTQLVAGITPRLSTLNLEPMVLRDLMTTLAAWQRDRLGQPNEAADLLRRALELDGQNARILSELAEIERRQPGAPLLRTLMQLSELVAEPNALLVEAVELATDAVGDATVAATAAERLFRDAARRLRDEVAAGGAGSEPSQQLVWALERLVQLHQSAGAPETSIAFLGEASTLPLPIERTRALRRQAAALAAEAGQRDRAIALFRAVLDDEPTDTATLAALADLCAAADRLPETLALRQQELAACQDRERRLAIRIEIVGLVTELLRRAGPIEALEENLRDEPGHLPSIEQLTTMLTESGQRVKLCDLLEAQAEIVEQAAQPMRAAALFRDAATIARTHLGDDDRAFADYRRAVALLPDTASLDALATLSRDKGDAAGAAQWLSRRLKAADPEERTTIALRLSSAYTDAGNDAAAIECLEAAGRDDPDAVEIRDLLVAAYRRSGNELELAELLALAAQKARGREELISRAREAAAIFDRLGAPERAIPVLEAAVAEAPDDVALAVTLANGLRVAGRLDEAEALLVTAIESFGRRKNAERAGVHLALAQVQAARPEMAAALAELDQASRMDVGNAAILKMQGDLARAAGELDRAERAYRALLLIVRRRHSETGKVGASEVLFELHQIARERGDAEQARELYESAVETASQSAFETDAMRRTLLERGEAQMLLPVLEMRLSAVQEGDEQAEVLVQIAELLDQHLGKPDDALERLLDAVRRGPEVEAAHGALRALAARQAQSRRYAEMLETLIGTADRAGDGVDDVAGFEADRLRMRLAGLLAEDLDDTNAAVAMYRTIAERPFYRGEAWQSMAALYRETGRSADELALLKEIIADHGTDLPDAIKASSLYRLAELALLTADADAADLDEGLATLAAAMALDEQHDRAASILGAATAIHTGSDSLLRHYGQAARASADVGLILDYLEKRAAQPSATLDQVSEAIELSRSSGELDRLLALLERAMDVAEAAEGGLSTALWVPAALADEHIRLGSAAAAVPILRRAAEAAEEAERGDAESLWFDLANLCAGPAEQPATAVEILEGLLEEHPGDPRYWQPLLIVLRETADESRLRDWVSVIVDGSLDPEERTAARLEMASLLLATSGGATEAASVLRAILDDEPGHAEASEKLASLYEQTGFDEELVDLLTQQLDLARDKEDLPGIKQLSVRLGSLLAKVRREDAMDVYRRALDWLPEDRELSLALLEQLSADDDPRERAEVLERLLATEEGEPAARLARDLVAQWQALDDTEGVIRALERGNRAAPDDAELRAMLEQTYRDADDAEPLARWLVVEAERIAAANKALPLLREAATLYTETLGQPAEAARALTMARGYAPADPGIVEQLVRAHLAAHQDEQAQAEVEAALEAMAEAGVEDGATATVYVLRGELETRKGDYDKAVESLEAAYSRDQVLFQSLVDGLNRAAAAARGRRDTTVERACTLRAVEVLAAAGLSDEAHDGLAAWIEREPSDRGAIVSLRDMDEAAENWSEVARGCQRLIALDSGDEQVDAALRLLDACGRAGEMDRAREGLERVYEAQPEQRLIRERLRDLYAAIGAHAESATLLLSDVATTEDQEERFELLRRAGELYFLGGDPDAALGALEQAIELKPDDHDTLIAVVDAYIGSERYADAGQLLEHAIAGQTRRRSPELSALQHRMARLAEVAADTDLQMQWLMAALDSDKNNGHVAAELATLAMQLGNNDVALQALRAVTLMRADGPLSRAMAFLLQAKIAHAKGEERRALLWARKARSEDPELEEAVEFLRGIGDAV